MKESPSNRPFPNRPTNIRSVAVEVLQGWAQTDRFALDILDEACRRSGLSGPNAAFLHDMVLTSLRNLTLLDHWIHGLTDGKHLDHRTRWLLRVGLCQVILLAVPSHAAVNETVAAAGKSGALINAVLRRATREPERFQVDPALPLSVRSSHPEFLVKRWIKRMGIAKAEALCEWNQSQAPLFVRANALVEGAEQKLAELEGLEDAGGGFFECASLPREAVKAGLCYVQDPSTAIAPLMLAPDPSHAVLDACAAPGGKTTFMAALMANSGTLIACDASSARLERLRENLNRLRVHNTAIHHFDLAGEQPPPFAEKQFDRILLDVPCSNTGVMRRRIDVRWRLKEEEFTALAAQQKRLLERGLKWLKPGGSLVYSTCSIDKEENQDVVSAILAQHPDFELIESRLVFPPKDQMDGAYAARIVRKQ